MSNGRIGFFLIFKDRETLSDPNSGRKYFLTWKIYFWKYMLKKIFML